MTAKKFTNEKVIAKMVGFYGTLETARDAYKVVREVVRKHNAENAIRGCLAIWVNGRGEIKAVDISEVAYTGSADATAILPC